MVHKGSCHCGKITFEVQGTIDQVIECNCSICAQRGYLLWFAKGDQFKLTCKEANLSTYMFNKRVIEHHFCATCGSAPFGRGRDPEGVATFAVNVRCLDGFDLSSVKKIPYDGRSA